MKTNRRDLLKTLGLGAGLMPFLPLTEVEAQEFAPPARLLIVYSSNGTVHENWVPTMSGSELVLSPILEPLERHKSELLVVDGLRYAANIEKGEQEGHYGGMNTALTATASRITDPNDPDRRSLATGISIDQLVAQSLGLDTKFSSLVTGVQVENYASTVAAISYSGSMQPIVPEHDPQVVFDRLFSDFQPEPTHSGPSPRELARKSALDFSRSDLNRLKPRLSRVDRQKLDAHETALRELERSLSSGVGALATESCAVPSIDGSLDPWENSDIPDIGRTQMELAVMAMACDLTRVATVQFGRAGAQHRFTWLGDEFLTDPDNGPNDSTKGIHGLAHNELNPESRAKLTQCHRWYAGEVAHLFDLLQAIPEGEGTMADHTLVVWMNEMGTGNHSLEQTPWVLLGNPGGRLVTNQVLSFPGASHGKVLTTIARAMGLEDVDVFGDPDYDSSVLSGALA